MKRPVQKAGHPSHVYQAIVPHRTSRFANFGHFAKARFSTSWESLLSHGAGLA
jgi:hypothetical protein